MRFSKTYNITHRSQCYENIINCRNPEYCGYETYWEAVWAYAVMDLKNKLEYLEPEDLDAN